LLALSVACKGESWVATRTYIGGSIRARRAITDITHLTYSISDCVVIVTVITSVIETTEQAVGIVTWLASVVGVYHKFVPSVTRVTSDRVTKRTVGSATWQTL